MTPHSKLAMLAGGLLQLGSGWRGALRSYSSFRRCYVITITALGVEIYDVNVEDCFENHFKFPIHQIQLVVVGGLFPPQLGQ